MNCCARGSEHGSNRARTVQVRRLALKQLLQLEHTQHPRPLFVALLLALLVPLEIDRLLFDLLLLLVTPRLGHDLELLLARVVLRAGRSLRCGLLGQKRLLLGQRRSLLQG